MIPLCNLHTHTQFCDGKSSAEEMVLSAIEIGCQTLGFSGHSPRSDKVYWSMTAESVEKYKNEIKRLQREYADKIDVVLGLEVDSHCDADLSGFEYLIGSVHAIKNGGKLYDVDMTAGEVDAFVQQLYGGDYYKYCADYYNEVRRLPEVGDFNIIGHFDLVTKHNECGRFFDENDKRYKDVAIETLDHLISKDYIFEMNTGAISRGYKKLPYPARFILRRMAEKGARIILNSDAHHKDAVFCNYAESVEYARECGVRSLVIMKDRKFCEFAI